jgi:hypothetical protein
MKKITNKLDAIKSRELLKQAVELDNKQRVYSKGKKLPTIHQIVGVISDVRKEIPEARMGGIHFSVKI